jgi:phospholipase/carboxylesterase
VLPRLRPYPQHSAMTHQSDLPLVVLAERPRISVTSAPLVMLLHGYGSNEEDLIGLASAFDPSVLALSLRAPLPLGYGSFAWFEIAFTHAGIAVDARQAERSSAVVADCIERAVAAYSADPRRVFLVGFSQGATMAGLVALTRPDLVAGAALLSGIVPSEVLDQLPDTSRLTGKRFLVGHGTDDVVVPVAHGRATRELLEQLGVDLVYREYQVGHGISQAGIQDLAAWLGEGLAKGER